MPDTIIANHCPIISLLRYTVALNKSSSKNGARIESAKKVVNMASGESPNSNCIGLSSMPNKTCIKANKKFEAMLAIYANPIAINIHFAVQLAGIAVFLKHVLSLRPVFLLLIL